jgi:hypothetical protein
VNAVEPRARRRELRRQRSLIGSRILALAGLAIAITVVVVVGRIAT